MASAYQPNEARSRDLALCLSGGGFRAALFHLGSLRRLNEAGVLSRVATISSVSGGSITNGLLAKWWPKFKATGHIFSNFVEFETDLKTFCSRDIRTAPLIWDRLDPRNWPTLLSDDHSATDFLAQQYEDHLVPGITLGTLAKQPGPRFVFCASNLQTGVNFEQSADKVGDYWLGYAQLPELPLAEAIAASSAFPIAFPPLILKKDPQLFLGGKLGQSPLQRQLARRIVLSDGGVYDNLGLEPVWKTHASVLCSDGGKPFDFDTSPGEFIAPRLLRVQEVIGNQALALRKRWLVSSFEKKVYGGSYWGIGTEISGYPTRGPRGYEGPVLEALRKVRTDLNTFSAGEQSVLMNHGWALTDAALKSYCGNLITEPLPAGNPPDQHLLDDAQAALRALSGK